MSPELKLIIKNNLDLDKFNLVKTNIFSLGIILI